MADGFETDCFKPFIGVRDGKGREKISSAQWAV